MISTELLSNTSTEHKLTIITPITNNDDESWNTKKWFPNYDPRSQYTKFPFLPHVLEEEDSHLSLMQEPNMASPGKSEPGRHQAIPWPRFPWHKE